MAKEQVRDALRTYVLENFLPGEPPDTLEDSTLLVTSGVIPSISLVELVTFIEDHFGVILEQEDIGAERMDSVNLMVDLIVERSGQQANRA